MAETENKSAKLEQVVIIDPQSVLHFKGPYTDVVTSYLTLTNPSDRRICFKVKTTAPRRYCVRPNNGVIQPTSTTKIAVMLQPFDFENQPDRSKHKFMIQTMFEPEPEIDHDTMWKMYPDQIMDSKLKCVFDNTSEPNAASGESNLYPALTYSNAENAMDLFSSQTSESAKPNSTMVNESNERQSSNINTNLAPNTNITTTTTTSTTSNTTHVKENLKEDYDQLLEENNSLRSELMLLKEDGLRKRITSDSSLSSGGDLPGYKGPSTADVGAVDQITLLAQPQVIGMVLIALFLGLILGKIFF